MRLISGGFSAVKSGVYRGGYRIIGLPKAAPRALYRFILFLEQGGNSYAFQY